MQIKRSLVLLMNVFVMSGLICAGGAGSKSARTASGRESATFEDALKKLETQKRERSRARLERAHLDSDDRTATERSVGLPRRLIPLKKLIKKEVVAEASPLKKVKNIYSCRRPCSMRRARTITAGAVIGAVSAGAGMFEGANLKEEALSGESPFSKVGIVKTIAASAVLGPLAGFCEERAGKNLACRVIGLAAAAAGTTLVGVDSVLAPVVLGGLLGAVEADRHNAREVEEERLDARFGRKIDALNEQIRGIHRVGDQGAYVPAGSEGYEQERRLEFAKLELELAKLWLSRNKLRYGRALAVDVAAVHEAEKRCRAVRRACRERMSAKGEDAN